MVSQKIVSFKIEINCFMSYNSFLIIVSNNMNVEHAPLTTIPESLGKEGLKLAEKMAAAREDVQDIYQEGLILIAQIIGLPVIKIPEIQNELQQIIGNRQKNCQAQKRRDFSRGLDNPPEKKITKTLARMGQTFSQDYHLIRDLCLEHGLEDPLFECGEYFLRLRVLKIAGLEEQKRKALAPLLLACCLEPASDQAILRPLLHWLKSRLKPDNKTSFSIAQKEEYFKILIGKTEAYFDFTTRLNQESQAYGQKVYEENSQELTELLNTWLACRFIETRFYSQQMIEAQAKKVPQRLLEIARSNRTT